MRDVPVSVLAESQLSIFKQITFFEPMLEARSLLVFTIHELAG